jgi:hypothetical protein
MKIKLFCLGALALSACNSNTPWQSYEDVERAPGTPEHVVLVNKDGSLKLDGKEKSPEDVTAFFAEAAGKEKTAYIFVVGEQGLPRDKLWAAQSLVEGTGVCAKSTCLDGYDVAAAPADPAKAN